MVLISVFAKPRYQRLAGKTGWVKYKLEYIYYAGFILKYFKQKFLCQTCQNETLEEQEKQSGEELKLQSFTAGRTAYYKSPGKVEKEQSAISKFCIEENVNKTRVTNIPYRGM